MKYFKRSIISRAITIAVFTTTVNLGAAERLTSNEYDWSITESKDELILQLNNTVSTAGELKNFFVSGEQQSTFLDQLNARVSEKIKQRTLLKGNDKTIDLNVKKLNIQKEIDSNTDGFLEATEKKINFSKTTYNSLEGSRELNAQYTTGIEKDEEIDNLKDVATSEYTVLYAMAGTPLLKSLDVPTDELFKSTNIERYLSEGESVAVFDNLPRWVDTTGGGIAGKNVFVWAMGGGVSQIPGYVPLFSLASNDPSQVLGSVEIDTPYNLLSRLAIESIQETFYKDCYDLHPESGAVDKEFNNAPLGENYYCGQYPFGNTAAQTIVHGDYFRHATTLHQTAKEVHWQPEGPLAYPRMIIWDDDPEGVVYNPYNPLLYFDIPIYVSNKQLRSEANPNASMLVDNTVTGTDLVDTKTYQFGEAQNESNALVHPMDISIRHFYPSHESKTDTLNVEIMMNLPGFEICNPWTQKEVVLNYQGALGSSYEARTSQFKLGCISIGSLPLKIEAELSFKDVEANLDGYVSNTGPQAHQKLKFKSVQFMSVPTVAITDSVGLKFVKNDFPQPIQDLADKLINILNKVAKLDIGNSGNFGGTLFWYAASDKVSEMILDQLDNLGNKMTKYIQPPREHTLAACNSLFPVSYRDVSNAFYPIYKLCRTTAVSLGMPKFINPTNVSIEHPGAYRELTNENYSPINLAGIPWASPDTKHKSYLCASGELDCLVQYDRPWYSKFDPEYRFDGGDKFSPQNYTYKKGGGISIGLTADVSAAKPLWNLMRCLTPAANKSFAYHPHSSGSYHRQQIQSDCFVEALGTMCQLYGSAPALTDMWLSKYGYAPKIGGYANYCQWYEDELNPDNTPQWKDTVTFN